jgi:hypothetical protein
MDAGIGAYLFFSAYNHHLVIAVFQLIEAVHYLPAAQKIALRNRVV